VEQEPIGVEREGEGVPEDGPKRVGSRTRNYLAGLFGGYAYTLATVFVGLWLTPFTLRFLDREQYAIFTLTGDMLIWLGLLDLGITAGLRVHAAQLMGRPDNERLSRLVSTAVFCQTGVVVLVLLVGAVLSVGFPHFFSVRADLQRDATWVMLLMVIGTSMGLGTQTFSALLVANQKQHIDYAILLLMLVVRTALAVVLLELGWGLYSLVVANLVARGSTAILAVARTFRLLPVLQIRRRLVSWNVAKELGSLGVWFTFGALAGIVINYLDNIVAAKVLSLDMVTTLTLTARLYSLFGGVLGQITDTARPMLGQMIGEDKMQEVNRNYRHLVTLSTGSAIVVAASLWAGNGSFVTKWVGNENYGGFWLDFALALNLIVHQWVLPNRAVLSAGMVVRQPVIIRIVEGFLNLVISIALAKYLGIVGIALGTAIAGVMTSCWYMPLLTARMFHTSFLSLLGEDLRRLLPLLLLVVPLSYGSRMLADNMSGFGGAIVGMVMTGVGGIGIMWVVSMDKGLRKLVLETVVKLRKRGLGFSAS
jgi:O-antigen/teichoic acid export membrane protein